MYRIFKKNQPVSVHYQHSRYSLINVTMTRVVDVFLTVVVTVIVVVIIAIIIITDVVVAFIVVIVILIGVIHFCLICDLYNFNTSFLYM